MSRRNSADKSLLPPIGYLYHVMLSQKDENMIYLGLRLLRVNLTVV